MASYCQASTSLGLDSKWLLSLARYSSRDEEYYVILVDYFNEPKISFSGLIIGQVFIDHFDNECFCSHKAFFFLLSVDMVLGDL